jgi:hypothetical protein
MTSRVCCVTGAHRFDQRSVSTAWRAVGSEVHPTFREVDNPKRTGPERGPYSDNLEARTGIEPV